MRINQYDEGGRMQTPYLDVRHANCMEIMPSFEENHFDLAVVDPPYGIHVKTNMGRRRGQTPSTYHPYAGEDKEAPPALYFKELVRVSKNQIIWGGNYFMTMLPKNSPCWIVWDKKYSNHVSFASAELAWTSFESPIKTYRRSSFDPQRIHPTQKPIQLYSWIFANYAQAGMKIIDTHLGSGSIAIAAHYAGLHLTACELDLRYFNAACARIKNKTQQMTLDL